MSIGGSFDPTVSDDWDSAPTPVHGTPSASVAGTDAPRNGWAAPAAPNGRVLPLDLSQIDEDRLLRPGKKAAIYAVGSGPQDFHPEREPLVLVHGIQGDPKDLQAIVERFKDSRYQLYVLAYDDYGRRTSLNGNDFADELRCLQRTLGPGRDATIVGYSLGGIVTRQALNELAVGPGRGLEKFGEVRFVAVDSPWHGYGGPSDAGVSGFFMNVARPFMADGLEDMRAESAMFAGDPDSSDPAARAGLLNVTLPENVSVDMVAAERGGDVLDYTEGVLADLPAKLVEHYKTDEPVRGDPRLVNYYHAILASDDYFEFQDEMRDLADQGKLTPAAVRAGLEKYYPRFPGDHSGIVREQPGAGKPSFLDYLSAKLGGG